MTSLREVRRVSGGEAEHGHLEEFRTDPIGLMQRLRDECGDVGYFQLAGKNLVKLKCGFGVFAGVPNHVFERQIEKCAIVVHKIVVGCDLPPQEHL